MISEYAVGIEVAEDRTHTSIATAGYLDGDIAMVEVAAYLDGTDAVPAVLKLRGERAVVATVVDAHSPAGSLVKRLSDAGVDVLTPSAGDVAVAYATFMDELAAGRLRHTGQVELTRAVRAAQRRPMGGAETWQRRGIDEDVSPLIACSLALYGLQHRPPPPPEPWVSWGEPGEPERRVSPPDSQSVGTMPGMTPRGPMAPPPTPRGLPNVRRD